MVKFLEIKNKTPSAADMYFYGDIVADSWGKWTDEDKCPQDIIDMLKECDGVSELNIYINSGGGSVWAGVAIYNILKRSKARKLVHIDGLAASIASVIALSGDEIIMPANSFLMIHKAWCMAQGNSDDLRETADMLDIIEKSIVNTYMENTAEGTDEAYIKELMSAETWLDAESAAELFPKITVTAAVEAAACISDFRYTNEPKNIFAKKEPEKQEAVKKEPEKQENADNEFDSLKLQNIKNFIFMEECENE